MMSIDALIISTMHKKAAAKGVNLNDPEAFKVFNENVIRATRLCEEAVTHVLANYQCQGCISNTSPQEVPCSPCEEKRRALEALQAKGLNPEVMQNVTTTMPSMTLEEIQNLIGDSGNANGVYTPEVL